MRSNVNYAHKYITKLYKCFFVVDAGSAIQTVAFERQYEF